MALNTKQEKSPQQLRLATTVFFFISGFGYSSWASRIPSVQQKLHLNEAQLGTVLLALPVGLMCTMPVTSKLLSRFAGNNIMLFGVLLFNLVLSLPGFTTSVWQLAFLLFFFGSSRNILTLSINAQAVSIQKMYDRSIIARFHGIWSLAGFAGAAVGFVMVSFSVATSWHLLAVSIFLILLTFYFYPATLQEHPVPQNNRPIFSLPDKSLLKFSLICFASMACENTMYDWGSIYFQKVIHATKSFSVAAFVIYMVAMTTGRFTGDILINKLGVTRLLKYSGWLIFGGLVLAVLSPYAFIAVLGFAMVGLGVSCIVPMVFSMAGKSKTMNTGQALAAISTVGYLGFLMVPPLVGFVAQAANLRWSFGIIALLGLLIVWMVSTIKNGD